MSTQILIKRSTTTGAVPTTSDIAVGELAINTVDKRIFTNNSGTIVELGTTPTTQAVTGNASVGGTFDVVGAVTVGNFTADGTVDLTAATVTIPAPTADTHPATKKYVDDEVNAILDGAPAALNTLNEIAAAINDDANLYTTLTNSIATKLSLAGGTMTGSIDMGANSITTSADPATSNTLTRKSYVDGLYQSTVDAEVSAANALASEQAAATSATNSATSASASATSASAASTSATNAASSATAAAGSATSSANSATASATSATQSAASATQAQALVDSIESFYLGAEASAPTVDDNGDPLQAGDWYFNTTDNATYIYNGSSWQSVSPDLVSDLTPQLGGNLDTNGNDVLFGDNDKAIFGAGSDLQIYHDGSNSVIHDAGTGNLLLRAGSYRLNSADNSDNMIRAVDGGAVTLFNNGSAKLATTSTGIDVTGTATMDGLTVDGTGQFNKASESNVKVRETSAGAFINLYQQAGTSYLIASDDAGTINQNLHVYTGQSKSLTVHGNKDISFYEDTGTTAKFFWDASAESLGIGTSSPAADLEVYSSGTGLPATTGSTPSASTKLRLSSSSTTGVLDFGSNSAAPWIQATDRTNLALAYNIALNPNGGNVGIGTSSPIGTLDVYSATSSVSYVRTAAQTLKLTASDSSSLVDIANSAGSPISFTTGVTERMRLDSSGNLLVGKTSSNSSVVGCELLPSGIGSLTANGNQALYLNRTTSDGAIVEFRKDGTTVGSIGTFAGRTYIYGNAATQGFRINTGSLASCNSTGTETDASCDLGNTGSRFKNLYLSGGVYLGGTGSANKLDDYETGTWTPVTLNDGFNTGISHYTAATYTKVGRIVTVHFTIVLNSSGKNTSYSRVTGLPFTSSNKGTGIFTSGALSTQSIGSNLFVDSNQPYLWLHIDNSSGTSNAFYCSATYETA